MLLVLPISMDRCRNLGFREKSPEEIQVCEGRFCQFCQSTKYNPDLFHDFFSGWIVGQWIAAASDLILVELGGGQHSLSHNLFVCILISIKVWEESSQVRWGSHWWAPPCAMLLLVLVTGARIPWNNGLTCLSGFRNGSLLLLLPIFQVMDLIKLYVRSPGHHHVYQGLNDTFVNARDNTLVKW